MCWCTSKKNSEKNTWNCWIPPKSSVLIGFSIINHPFWDTTIFGNTHMLILFFPSSLVILFSNRIFDGPFREATPATSQPLAQRNCPVAKSVSSNCGQTNDFEQQMSVSNRIYWVYRVYWHLLRSIGRKPTAEAVLGDSVLSCLGFGLKLPFVPHSWKENNSKKRDTSTSSRAYRMTLLVAWHWAKFAKQAIQSVM